MTTEALHLRPLPSQYEGATIYQIFLRSFTNQGTLKAAESLLEHVADLGVDIIYLCPVVEADGDMNPESWSPRQKQCGLNNPKNPYRIKDYYKIDPEYGSDADLKNFVNEAHHLGMKVILDIVYLHCGPTATLIEAHSDFVQRNEDHSIKCNEYNFPLINFESDALREYLWQNMEYFIREFDVDGYRCDVAFEVPLDFWEAARPRMEALKPDIFMLAESYGNAQEYVCAFDVGYGFRFPYELYDLLDKKKTVAEFVDFLNELDAKTQGGRVLRAMDNHDLANDFADKRVDARYSFEAVNCALALCFCLDGIPFLYNGQEFADTNQHSIWANRAHGHNNTLDWSNAQTAKGQQRLTLIKSLIALRKQEPALSSGTCEWLKNSQDETVISFARKTGNETIINVFNLSESTTKVTIPSPLDCNGFKTIAQHGAEAQVHASDLSIDLLPFAYSMMKLKI
jgi:glycosidase